MNELKLSLLIIALALSGCSTIDRWTDGTLDTGIYVAVDCTEVQSMHHWGLFSTGSKVKKSHAEAIIKASPSCKDRAAP